MFGMIIATLFFVGAVFGRELPNCVKEEEYKSCGTACQRTCLDIYEDDSRSCTNECVPGCFCKDGFVRENEDGPCVPAGACRNVPKCRKNEMYSECATLCPLTCQDKEPRACPDVCVEGCICQEGYIRSVPGGPCIPKDACDAKVY